MKSRWADHLAATFCVLCVVAGWPGAAQESDSFKVRSLSTSALAQTASSSSFNNAMTATFVRGAAGVCPAGLSATLGFFSVLGAQPISVVLRVDKNSGQNDSFDLSWTGQASGFAVYGATTPDDTASPTNLLTTTSSCSMTDTDSATEQIFFYRVEPVSP